MILNNIFILLMRFWVAATQSSLHGDIKSTLVADHSKRTHDSGHFSQSDAKISQILSTMEKEMGVEEQLHTYTAQFARSTQSHRSFVGDGAAHIGGAATPDGKRHNRFSTTKFDENFKTHSLCESWNSGKQPDNLEWSESADRLLRVIGNGVVKNGYNMFMAPGQSQGLLRSQHFVFPDGPFLAHGFDCLEQWFS
ncbi:unnamed protein product [Anisakis simplex]|uniref:SCP domain-containing protein n=1 Tax=Anisakis simplex TaxID=6269 RepID=A0A0M3JZA1_ANISI|nr:unnamed protein product [Anisakis simplex]